MLLPVRVSPRRRVWVDVSFFYEKYLVAGRSEDVIQFHLKNARVDGIYEEEEVAHDVKHTIAGMLHAGASRNEIIDEVSLVYCIPIACLEEIVDEVEGEIATAIPV